MRLWAIIAILFAGCGPGSAPKAVDEGDAVFHGTIDPLDGTTRARMTGVSWHAGCPVPLRDLRLLQLNFWGFDGVVHSGHLVVHEDQAIRVRRVMRLLFEARFPIRQMRLVDAYGGSDRRSMAANNTSAFNCRFVSGTSSWSQHAYGRAIDVNPVQNPYVSGTHVSPRAGARYANRSLRLRGMIHAGDVVVRSFAAIGWGWGGSWSSPKDYQHFSASGD
jgi:hypothetical protein